MVTKKEFENLKEELRLAKEEINLLKLSVFSVSGIKKTLELCKKNPEEISFFLCQWHNMKVDARSLKVMDTKMWDAMHG